jgi:DNA-binding IscR family transcriptional regulator
MEGVANTDFPGCLFKDKKCRDFRTCPLRKVLGRLENRFVKELEAVSLASLLRQENRGRLHRADGKDGQSPSHRTDRIP